MMKKHREIHVSVILPCFNEEGNVEECYYRLLNVLEKYEYNILFVDDGSTDQTLSRIKGLAEQNSKVMFLSFSKNFGHQNALKAGYDYVHDVDCIVSMDVDLQHPPELIDRLIEKWQEGNAVVNTIKQNNKSEPFYKKMAARCFYSVINILLKQKIIVGGSDFRLLDKKVVEEIRTIKENTLFLREIIVWLGFKQCTVAFDVPERFDGKSKYTWRKQISLSIKGIISSSISPLRFAVFIGVFFGLLAFLYGFYALYIFWFTERAIAGWTSMIAGIMFIAGLQFLLIGIIGEYLGKTYLETKRRPLYIVDETNCLKYEFDFGRAKSIYRKVF